MISSVSFDCILFYKTLKVVVKNLKLKFYSEKFSRSSDVEVLVATGSRILNWKMELKHTTTKHFLASDDQIECKIYLAIS